MVVGSVRRGILALYVMYVIASLAPMAMRSRGQETHFLRLDVLFERRKCLRRILPPSLSLPVYLSAWSHVGKENMNCSHLEGSSGKWCLTDRCVGLCHCTFSQVTAYAHMNAAFVKRKTIQGNHDSDSCCCDPRYTLGSTCTLPIKWLMRAGINFIQCRTWWWLGWHKFVWSILFSMGVGEAWPSNLSQFPICWWTR